MNPNTTEAPPFGYPAPPHPSSFSYYQAPASTCYSPSSFTYYQPTNYLYYPSYPDTATPADNLSLQLSNLDLNASSTQVVFGHPTTLHVGSRRNDQNPRGDRGSISCLPRTRRSSIKSSSEFDESKFGVEIRTSVMIRNIPNKFSRGMLIELLDQHCARENDKAAMEGSPLSEYDFVYLPMDFKNKCNLGYAFVNLTTPLAGWRLYWAMHNCKWVVFSSSKITHICYARIQGKEAMVEHFRTARFFCNDEEYLPAVLSPPRNGTTSLTPPALLGIMMNSVRFPEF